ncbi:MAG: alpha/beta hydrolase [Pseudomonadota bacterium]
MRTLMLSGWAQPVDALGEIAPGAATFDYSAYGSPEASFAGLAALRDVEHLIGWSMGGQLALRAIAAGILAPKHLTLIGAPYRFVGADGMGAETFALFRASYEADPARTKTRFHGLVAKGHTDAKRVMGALSHHPQVEETARWLPWLDALAGYDMRDADLAKAPRTLIIHGMNDAIVPHAQAARLAALLPDATVLDWPETGHAPHLEDAAQLRAHVAAHRGVA